MSLGESRGELLGWINDLLQLNYVKVEQCGSGAVYCQIFDSIYQDVAMTKVKFSAKQEFEYMGNFKVLQQIFKKHKIDKPIPVELLIKCKALDNLEFLQWAKKFWDMHFPGGEYDPVARRSGAAGSVVVQPPAARSAPVQASSTTRRPVAVAPVRRPLAGQAAPRKTSRACTNAQTDQAVQQLTAQMNELRTSVDGLEKERDFYFAKLRNIEILIGARLESGDETMSEAEEETLKAIQTTLYSTEDGFEIPSATAETEENGASHEHDPEEEEEETF